MNILFVIVYLFELIDELLHFMKYLYIHNVHQRQGDMGTSVSSLSAQA